jgi:hypothetical protein
MAKKPPPYHIKLQRWLLIGIAVFLFIGGIFLLQLVRAVSTSGQPLPAETDSYVVDLLNEINTYREWLKGTMSEQNRWAIERHLAYAEYEATRQANMMLMTADPNKTPELPPPITDEPFPTGIFEGQGQEYKPSVARINNRWQGIVDGEYVTIWAGAPTNDLEQGILFIWRTYAKREHSRGARYLTPEKAGSIRIVDVQANRLILSTEDGDVFYFDVPGERFVSSLEEEVPTITPIPTSLPTATAPPYNPYP